MFWIAQFRRMHCSVTLSHTQVLRVWPDGCVWMDGWVGERRLSDAACQV